MKTRYVLVMLAALAFSMVETGEARAQFGGQGFGANGLNGFGFGGYGFGFDIGRLYRVLGRNVPHFAAFPPVYYSAPIPRTYGYSPFAYPPGFATPELPLQTVAAKEITNPYVPASTVTEKETTDQVTQQVSSEPQPLVVYNPYLVETTDGTWVQVSN